MARSVWPWVTAVTIVALSGCGVMERPQRPAWRAQAENACISQKRVRATAFLQPTKSIDGPSICGLEKPFVVTALQEGAVTIKGRQTLGCPQIAALDQWLAETVQPSAMKRFGSPVVELTSVGTFSCRPANNRPGARLSEHSFGNATDIGGFRLQDGRHILIVRDWAGGGEEERAFLREAISGACNVFTTVLGPGYDALHANHFHLDLANHGATNTGPRRICKPRPGQQNEPRPRDTLPAAPDIEDDEDMDIARAPAPGANRALAMRQLDAGIPATPIPPRAPTQARVYNPYGLVPSAAVGAAPRPLAPKPPATIRDDGAFVPEGDPSDWDVTSSIRRRK